MANIYKNELIDLTTTDNTVVYTTPADSRAIIKSILVSEDAGSGSTITLTITNAMNSTNSMVASGLCTDDGSTNNHVANLSLDRTGSGGSPFTTTTIGFNTVFETSGATLNDMDFVTVAIHGDLA